MICPPPRLKQSMLRFLQSPGSPTEGDKHQAVCVETWWVIQRNRHVLTNSSQQGPVRLGHRPLLAPGLCLLTLSRVKWSEMKEMFSSLPTWTENWFGRFTSWFIDPLISHCSPPVSAYMLLCSVRSAYSLSVHGPRVRGSLHGAETQSGRCPWCWTWTGHLERWFCFTKSWLHIWPY